MEKLTSHQTIKNIVAKHDFRFSKSLGQNFLVDENILNKIVAAADIQPEDVVIEIGPGAGTLTRALSLEAGKVIAIEIDRNLIPILKETLADRSNVRIIHGDVLETDLMALVQEESPGRPVKVVANLPYYITTPIIMKFLEEGIPLSRMIIMIQKEVADRMNAVPGTKSYGALTIAVQYYCNTDIVAKAPKQAFVPMPGVDSSIIRLMVREKPEVALKNIPLFFLVVKAGFSKRRKTLLNALSTFGPLGGKQEAVAALAKVGIDSGRRGETLTIEEFARLSNAYQEILDNEMTVEEEQTRE